MLNSVRRRLIFNSLLISLAAIIAVGAVSLIIANKTFALQEEDYLKSQATIFTPTITQSLLTNNLLELQRTVALAGVSSQVRVQILDANQQLIADSGERDALKLFSPLAVATPDVFVGIVVDESGRVVRISPPVSRQLEGNGVALSLFEPVQLFNQGFTFTAVSDARIRSPLTIGNTTVGYLELSQGPAVGESVLRGMRLALLGGSLVALLIALLVGLLSARQVTNPLRQLGQAAKAMSKENLSARATHSNLREYDQLAGQFNTMAERLSGTIARLERERNILRRIIADASHELRTPITALKTFNTLLQDESNPDTVGAAFIRESGKQIDQLDRLTGGMLDLSRLEARLSGTDFTNGDLRQAVSEAVEVLRPLSVEKNQKLLMTLPEELVLLPHDPAAMQQAVGNLLHNAIKYTPHDGEISVTLTQDVQQVQINVRDNGLGITPEIQSRIFDRFYRGPAQTNGGTGLGLAICREIVTIHNGSVQIESQAQQGCTFTIILPHHPDHQIDDETLAPTRHPMAETTVP